MSPGTPRRPEPATQVHFHTWQFGRQPLGHRPPTTVKVPGHQQMPHD
jgi:hypothetical protein